MTKKVLGFYRKDFVLLMDMLNGKKKIEPLTLNKVPVVSLEWLNNYLATHESIRDCVNRDSLKIAAAKQASQKTR